MDNLKIISVKKESTKVSPFYSASGLLEELYVKVKVDKEYFLFLYKKNKEGVWKFSSFIFAPEEEVTSIENTLYSKKKQAKLKKEELKKIEEKIKALEKKVLSHPSVRLKIFI